jgi:hypothetical protein
MDAASSGQPARGVVLGRLTQSHPDRIIMGTAILYLRDGAACAFPVGTLLQVVYTEQHGRRCVESVARASE